MIFTSTLEAATLLETFSSLNWSCTRATSFGLITVPQVLKLGEDEGHVRTAPYLTRRVRAATREEKKITAMNPGAIMVKRREWEWGRPGQSQLASQRLLYVETRIRRHGREVGESAREDGTKEVSRLPHENYLGNGAVAERKRTGTSQRGWIFYLET